MKKDEGCIKIKRLRPTQFAVPLLGQKVPDHFVPPLLLTLFQGEANTKKESQHRAAAQVLMALRQIEGVFWPQLILPQAAQYETEMIAEWLST